MTFEMLTDDSDIGPAKPVTFDPAKLIKRKGSTVVDITGTIVGNLKIIGIDNTKFGRLYWRCQCICGSLVSYRSNDLMRGKRKNCSQYCSAKVLSTNYKLHLWSLSVIKRDKNICQCCGISKFLEAHHLIKPSIDETLLFNISNGVTLCKKCHVAFHTQYTFFSFTPEDYFQFLETRKCLKC